MPLALIQQVIGINQEWLTEWEAYRKEDKKKPMTPRSIKMTTKWLLKYSESEQARLIEGAIMKGWEGLHYFPPDKQQTSRDTTILEDLTNTDWAR